MAKDTSESASEPEDSRSALLHKPTVLVPKVRVIPTAFLKTSDTVVPDLYLPLIHKEFDLIQPRISKIGMIHIANKYGLVSMTKGLRVI
ncbi:unnamed protein product [Protopolystoma xenopodis]|uniref:Uncharacterized protein n=1 Tax=Protopolystoma xenopodis TaxID=117903 RepID=A0A448WSU9_9PLAT|nr:unnamed protein product [Protopolystoma xenopodis]